MKKSNVFKRTIKYISDPDYRFRVNERKFKKHFDQMSDEEFIKKKYRSVFGKYPDLKSPKTYNEKLQWLKLYDRKDLYTTLVDKFAVKSYVAAIIGEQYIIPTLGVFDRFEDIDFDKLPERFVLKCTHDSGGLVICKDKSKLDKDKARETINASLKNDYYLHSREWPYKNVPRRIIAEEYLVDESGYELKDYKFFCFDGNVRALLVASDRIVEGEKTKLDFFDADFNHLALERGHSNSGKTIKKPEGFEEMKRLAEKLSEGFYHLRVDLYNINGKIYFGELTFFPAGGMTKFEPEKWDTIFGDWLVLPLDKESK